MLQQSKVIRCTDYSWDSVEKHEYKSGGTSFRDVHRCSLLTGKYHDLNFHTRYFEIQPAGFSTLEYHRHPHSVIVIRGSGQVILDERIEPLRLHDVIYIAPGTIHQFQACNGEPLGFICIVDRYRDKPMIPDDEILEEKIPDAATRQITRR